MENGKMSRAYSLHGNVKTSSKDINERKILQNLKGTPSF
jgi:hypothetical protein